MFFGFTILEYCCGYCDSLSFGQGYPNAYQHSRHAVFSSCKNSASKKNANPVQILIGTFDRLENVVLKSFLNSSFVFDSNDFCITCELNLHLT